MKNIKKNDLVEFNFKGQKMKGIIKGVYKNKKIARVRVIKDKIPSWHEWVRLNDLKMVDGGVNNE